MENEAQAFLNGLLTSMSSMLCKDSKDLIFYPPDSFAENAYVKSMDQYKAMHKKSVEDPEGFWKEIAQQFYFETKQPSDKKFFDYNFDLNKGPIFIKWMEGAKTNICYNVLDYNIEKKGLGDKVAFYWEGNDPKDEDVFTYSDILKMVCKFANVLKSLGVKKGDRVVIYMPMIIELTVVMLSCARIGAVHSIVFGGYSAEALADRISDANANIVITADGAWRGEKMIHLKEITDKAITKCVENGRNVEHCVVVHHLPRLNENKKCSGESPSKKISEYKAPYVSGRDKWFHELMEDASADCPPVWMDAEDPLFMLYTSGSTSKPKGVLHTTGGYMLYAATTFKYVFDYHPGDVYWCTADVGWITGHTYVAYGPLANGATSVMFEGTPFFPDNSRFWAIIEKYKVNQFYTAPTAIRSLMRFGDEPIKKHDLSSLKVLGSVGEPINPEAWRWYHSVVGSGQCPIVDTFWQTETGGHVLTPLPGATPAKPGSATFPFFGVVPVLLNENGDVIEGVGEGFLVFAQAWPGLMRTVYGDHARFESTYFQRFPGYYFTGDGAKRDEDGYLSVTGRVDDMLNISGHLLSTASVESALIEHKAVAESAVVAMPHKVKGEALYCFVTMREGVEFNDQVVRELKLIVREKIGPFAAPDVIQLAPALPKTRSGKIMRRILRKIAVGDSNFGDTSTLADEGVIQVLIKHRPASFS